MVGIVDSIEVDADVDVEADADVEFTPNRIT